MSKCVICHKTKDQFSQDYGYKQCEACSINEVANETN
jgi:hypothetical protein